MFPYRTVAASFVPSLDDVISHQVCGLALGVHVSPESVDVQMFPPSTTAASLVPSLDIMMPRQTRVVALGVHVSPESVDVQMFPLKTVAASLVPSLDDVMSFQISVVALDVHVSPKSVDVQMFPPQEAVTASLVPSLDDVMSCQSCGLSVGMTSVHEALTEASEANESNAASRTRSIVLTAPRSTGTARALWNDALACNFVPGPAPASMAEHSELCAHASARATALRAKTTARATRTRRDPRGEVTSARDDAGRLCSWGRKRIRRRERRATEGRYRGSARAREVSRAPDTRAMRARGALRVDRGSRSTREGVRGGMPGRGFSTTCGRYSSPGLQSVDVTIANSESFKCFTSPIETPACVCDFPRFQHPA